MKKSFKFDFGQQRYNIQLFFSFVVVKYKRIDYCLIKRNEKLLLFMLANEILCGVQNK